MTRMPTSTATTRGHDVQLQKPETKIYNDVTRQGEPPCLI